MTLMVHYGDLSDPLSECWLLNTLRSDLASALAVAREGYARSEDYPDATGFRLVDEDGLTITEEQRTRR